MGLLTEMAEPHPQAAPPLVPSPPSRALGTFLPGTCLTLSYLLFPSLLVFPPSPCRPRGSSLI